MSQSVARIPLVPDSPGKRVVIVGGGFGGIHLARNLHRKGFQLVLIDSNNYHTFQPLLYQVATGGLEPDSIAYPLRKIFKGYRDFYFRMARFDSVDIPGKNIQTSIGTLDFDYLVLALGSTSNFFGMDRVGELAMPLKSLTDALNLRSLILQNLEKSVTTKQDRDQLLNFVVAGGGPTGVETAGALCELKKHVLPGDYPELDIGRVRIILVEAGSQLLGVMSQSASENARKSLEKMGVEVKTGVSVTGYDGTEVTLSDGEKIATTAFIWSAGVKGCTVKGIDSGLIVKGNRVKVDRFNRLESDSPVFIIGDLAYMEEEAYPKGHPMVAQVAIQQAARLAKNLVAMEKGQEPVPFTYKDLGSLATIGRNRAVADFPYIRLSGFPAWVLWMAVHLMTLVGFRNRLVVFINWLWNYISYDRAIRLIIRPFHPAKKSEN